MLIVVPISYSLQSFDGLLKEIIVFWMLLKPRARWFLMECLSSFPAGNMIFTNIKYPRIQNISMMDKNQTSNWQMTGTSQKFWDFNLDIWNGDDLGLPTGPLVLLTLLRDLGLELRLINLESKLWMDNRSFPLFTRHMECDKNIKIDQTCINVFHSRKLFPLSSKIGNISRQYCIRIWRDRFLTHRNSRIFVLTKDCYAKRQDQTICSFNI